jgi:DNA-binding NarL/FixJ family response regulator
LFFPAAQEGLVNTRVREGWGQKMSRTRILLADDHTLFCSLLKDLLEPEFEVVGSVSDGHQLLKAAETLRPDAVVVDIGMPLLNGLEAGRRLKGANPKLKVIYLTMSNNVEYAREAMQAGASAFVLKNSQSADFLLAIRHALRGVSYVAPEIREAMNEVFIRDPKAVDRPQHLTDRQLEVLQQLAEGRSLKEIASSLQISYRTVRFHKVRLMEELGITKNTELVKYAMKRGIVSPT